MIEMTIPSSLDSTLAPPGHHICLVFSQQLAILVIESISNLWDTQLSIIILVFLFIIMTNDHPSNHLQSPDMHLTIFGMAHGMNRPGIDCILSLRLGRSRTKKSQIQTTNFSRLVDKQSYIIHATSSREEYANVVIDTIEQYAPGFRWSERQILECFHTCIANPHKSHSLKLRAGQASLARRFFPLLSWRGSLVLLEVHHLNHVQHIIKVFFFTEWRMFNVIW